MWLIAVYIVLTVAGTLIAYALGLVVEHPRLVGFAVEQPQTTISLTVFLALYFLNLWVAWLIAVWLTRPRQPAA
jgi:hypothetical protein